MTSKHHHRRITRADLKETVPTTQAGTLPAPVAPDLSDNTIYFTQDDKFVTITISYPQMAAGQELDQHLQFIRTDGSKANNWTFTHTLSAEEAQAKKVTWEVSMSLVHPENYPRVDIYYVVTITKKETSKSLELKIK